jgi:acyl-coenzyme A thioesterase PaaI-like protein
MTSSAAPAIQDCYPETFAHCFGCGRLNPEGHRLKSRLLGDAVVAGFTAPGKYTGGVPGKAYGGLVASLLDCHGTASAAAYAARSEGIELGGDTPPPRFVTASLKIDFRQPTPLGTPLEIRGQLRSLEGRKAWIDLTLRAGDVLCATAEMLAVRLPGGPSGS